MKGYAYPKNTKKLHQVEQDKMAVCVSVCVCVVWETVRQTDRELFDIAKLKIKTKQILSCPRSKWTAVIRSMPLTHASHARYHLTEMCLSIQDCYKVSDEISVLAHLLVSDTWGCAAQHSTMFSNDHVRSLSFLFYLSTPTTFILVIISKHIGCKTDL